MSARGSVFRRCSCRSGDGRELGRRCPRLASDRRHGTWTFSVELPVRANGKRRQVKRGGFPTRADAADALGRVLQEESRGVDTIAAGRLTVGEWLTAWLDGKADIRPTTLRVYRGHVDAYLVPQLGRYRLSELRPQHVSAAIRDVMAASAADPKRRTIGPATGQRIRATLRSALSDAVTAQLVSANVAERATLAKVSRPRAVIWTEARTAAFWAAARRLAAERAKPGTEPSVTYRDWRDTPHPPVAVWTAEQLGRFLDEAARDRLGPMLEVIALSGLRRGECCGMRWSDLDLDRGLLVVSGQRLPVGYQVIEGEPKTAAGEGRPVELDGHTIGVLLERRLTQDSDRAAWGSDWIDTGHVFTDERGRPWHPEYVTKRFAHLAYRAGLPPIRLHDLRHGQGSLMLAAGVDIALVSKRLGHSSVSITSDTYSHMLEGVGRLAAERAAALIPRRSRSTDPAASLPER